MFPSVPAFSEHLSSFYAGERAEYVALTVRQLRCGKTALLSTVISGGTVLPVAKFDGLFQREVWHGTRVSNFCAKPPPPRFLGVPLCLRG